jgi:hypothetical protein
MSKESKDWQVRALLDHAAIQMGIINEHVLRSQYAKAVDAGVELLTVLRTLDAGGQRIEAYYNALLGQHIVVKSDHES